jgi:hypothetical protein
MKLSNSRFKFAENIYIFISSDENIWPNWHLSVVLILQDRLISV